MNTFLYTLVLLGSIQGFIVCGLLLNGKNRSLATRLLAAIILLLALPGVHIYLHYINAYEFSKVTQVLHDSIPMTIIMPLGPLIYFYVQSLLLPSFRLTHRSALHFLPVLIDLIPKLAGIALATGWLSLSREQYSQFDDVYNKYADLPRWLSVSAYLFLSMRALQVQLPTIHQKIQRWLKIFTASFLAFQIIWLAYQIPYLIPAYSDKLLNAVAWFPLYIPLTILVYWLGIQGYINSLVILKKKTDIGPEPDKNWQQLTDAMRQQQLYLDPTLTVQKLAAQTNLTTRQISALLNQHQSINFNTFVNQYRVEAFKTKLKQPDAQQYTIAALAEQCGFNSAASFQRIFKQQVGMAPTAFLKTIHSKHDLRYKQIG